MTVIFTEVCFQGGSQNTSREEGMKRSYYITMRDGRRKKMVPEFYVTGKIKISSHPKCALQFIKYCHSQNSTVITCRVT